MCLRACVLGGFACLVCLCAYILACLRAWPAYVLACSRAWQAWRARVFDVLACLRVCYDEMFYFLTCLRAWCV